MPDNVEVTGFTYAGKTWYGNPLLADTNQDGVFDGAEWDPSKPDTDGDGTPDLYDYDDDGDAVPDEVDISRTGRPQGQRRHPHHLHRSQPAAP